jgi:hypothetical protein
MPNFVFLALMPVMVIVVCWALCTWPTYFGGDEG